MNFSILDDDPFETALRLYRKGACAEVVRTVRVLGNPETLSLDLLNLAGVCAKRCKEVDAAESYYRQVLARDASHTAARNNLAILLQETGRIAEAETHYREAMQVGPADALPRLNLGNLYLAAKRYAEAEVAYAAAQTCAPAMPEILRGRAELCLATKRRTEAERFLRQALTLRPTYLEVVMRLIDLLYEDKRLEETAVMYRHALALEPDNAEIINNFGILLHEIGQFEASESHYRRALTLRPDYAEAWNNLAVLVQKLKRFDEAEGAYQQALVHRPDYAAARCNYGLLCLTQGRFTEGWPLYEARYAPDRTVPVPKLSKPQWRGESLEGKSVLIWNEQGMGDEIQFCRYAKILKAKGARRIGLVCKKPLTTLLRSLDGIDDLYEEETRFSIRPYDYWTFPLSIPLYLCPTPDDIPAELSYLYPDPALMRKWASRLKGPGYKVGLVWKGRAEYTNDANRSISSLRQLAPLWSLPGITFFSLQKGEAEAEAANPPEGQPLIALGAEFQDFSDTAAVVSQLDLVICVDTGVAHLCGALGVPCWVLLPYVGTDWRWMLDRSDSPWYPSVRLFRQSGPHAWAEVLAHVKEMLGRSSGNFVGHVGALWREMRALPADSSLLVESMTPLLLSRECKPDSLSFASWCTLASLLHKAGRAEAADQAYRLALALDGNVRGLWHNFAALCKSRRQYDEACQAYARAFAVQGDYPEGYYNLGNLREESGNFAEAEICYRRAIELRPDYAEAWYNLGVVCKAQDRLDAAESAYRHAISLREHYSEAHNNLGLVLQAQSNALNDAAETEYRKALAIAPRYAEAHNNLGVVLQEQHCFDEAAVEFETAMNSRVDYYDAQWNLSLMHLMRGHFLEAWPLFAARTRISRPQSFPPPLPFPPWQGESLSGKRILVWPEQGFGDEIQFCRYVTLLKHRGAATVTIACKPPLYRLFSRLSGVDHCLEITEGRMSVPLHDYWVFTMSLPGIFGTDLEHIPAQLPYLTVTQEDRERFLPKFPVRAGMRIGMVWRGSDVHPNDRNRSLPDVRMLGPLWTVPDVTFYSLQRGDVTVEGLPVTRLDESIRDFSDTAAALSHLDLLICVDTAIAHLAGALNIPVWVLLPFAGLDWRWMTGRDDSPWYPETMRLFRQSPERNWESVVLDVCKTLRAIDRSSFLRC